MVFAHGFGCDQNMWRFVAPAFESDFKVVLFDHVGAGHSDLSAYDPIKYSSLAGYADDVVEIGRDLGLMDAVFVGTFGKRYDRRARVPQGARDVRAPCVSWPICALYR